MTPLSAHEPRTAAGKRLLEAGLRFPNCGQLSAYPEYVLDIEREAAALNVLVHLSGEREAATLPNAGLDLERLARAISTTGMVRDWKRDGFDFLASEIAAEYARLGTPPTKP